MAKQFSIIPTNEELAKLGRDLHFYDVENDTPQVLTLEQVARYNRDGYIAPVRIFSDAEITSIRTYFDDLLNLRYEIRRRQLFHQLRSS